MNAEKEEMRKVQQTASPEEQLKAGEIPLCLTHSLNL